jgi:hypothetical protein
MSILAGQEERGASIPLGECTYTQQSRIYGWVDGWMDGWVHGREHAN